MHASGRKLQSRSFHVVGLAVATLEVTDFPIRSNFEMSLLQTIGMLHFFANLQD